MLLPPTSNNRVLFLAHYIREIPLAWFFAGCLIARLGIFLSSATSPRYGSAVLRRFAFAASLLILFAYLAIVLSSLGCFTIQQDESNILSISAAGLRGLPVYNPPASPDSSYSLMYGPVTFLIYSVVLIAGGVDHFWIVRGAVVIANFGLCAAFYVLLRRFVPAFTAIALLVFPLSVLLQFPQNSLGVRADIWIVLFATLAILCSSLAAELPAVILTGIMGGVMIGLKISAGPAILFPLLLLYRRFGFRAIITTSLVTIATALAPFALTNISLHNYVSWVLFTRSEGLSPAELRRNIPFALFLISPCVLMELFVRRFGMSFRRRLPEFLLIVLCLVLAVLTSKYGSGPWYFWHVVPSIVVYLALVSRDMSEVSANDLLIPIYYIAVACTLFACVDIPRACQNVKISLMTHDVALARQSIDRYLAFYRERSSIQMGYGSVDGDYRTSPRYVLVYKGQPYTLEGNTGRFETVHLPFPINVLNQMKHCKDDVWLVPLSQKPFDLWVFPDVLRRTFIQNYRVDRNDGIYDVWVCNHAVAH
ncbi:hypothetical protein RBB77_07085 [Tunturibacter psychrotolerans]|uniref:Glycosyltransferase RgtA/B/C/D-like domain-containing protein n=1 Tax=Tunturiibacter psychrotolerans TaxID=3069686 RepID=A0AAU7ZUM3_9BACT